MLFGACLPTMWPVYGACSAREAIQEAARAAEAFGYASVWAPDHVIVPKQYAELGHIIEPLTTLASLIHLVPHLQLGTSALVLPQRHAVLVAKQVAALDVLSDGRFILGIGAGWVEEEFRLLQAGFERRGAATDEAIDVMLALWHEPTVSFHGQFYDFSEALFYPKPATETVPLWICGNTRAAICRAVRCGVAWNPFEISLDDFKAGVEYLQSLTQDKPSLTISAHMRVRMGTGTSANALLAGSAEEITARLKQYQQAGALPI